MTHPFYASCISVTTHLQVGRLTCDSLIIDRNHDDHAPFWQAHTNSRYSNTAVTLIEQSQVYNWLYALTKTKQTTILKIKI